MAELARERPDDAVLSEEGIDDKARLIADRVWIVDPLDGTREFGEPGRNDWAVHVALWARDASAVSGELPGTRTASAVSGELPGTRTAAAGSGDLVAGAVALPAQECVLSTVAPMTFPADAQRQLRMVVSRSRASALVKDVAARLNAELVPWGSAGAKVATVITGENDVYLHSGGFYEWDTAAPVAVARANGFHVSRIDGSPVVYNQEDPLLPDILVCRPAIAPVLLNAIRSANGGSSPREGRATHAI
jgi:3'(2'), 5'-bisphosphate nucleotidase